PHRADLERATEAAGRTLVERLAIYPEFVPVIPAARVRPRAGTQGPQNSRVAPDPGYFADAKFRDDSGGWIDAALVTPLLRHVDAAGLAREDAWAPGGDEPLPAAQVARLRGAALSRKPLQSGLGAMGEGTDPCSPTIAGILDRVAAGERLAEADIVALFDARGADFAAVCRTADRLRAARCGDTVTYIVNRNINYTNICTYGCKFCAFSKGRHNLGHRDKPYDLDMEEISARTAEAWARGATEVCLQGGIKPSYTGETYLAIVGAVKRA